MKILLDLKGYKRSKFVEFRHKVAAQTLVASDTVDAEALYVRLAYMAIRKITRQGDAAALGGVLASLGSSPSVKYTFEYVCPPFNPEAPPLPPGEKVPLRRKD
jgi:hypothetical protein